MSAETLEWLNENTMIGFTAEREKYAGQGWTTFNTTTGQNEAWWHQDGYKLGYPGAIPADEVIKHLFHWTPVECPITLRVPCGADEADGQDGTGAYYRLVPDMQRKAMIRPDNDTVFGYFGKESYKPHLYPEWLIDGPAKIVDSELGIGTAGLLRGGGVAYVTLELPDMVRIGAGMDIRPWIVASTSLDGTRATTFKTGSFAPVCDNSLDAFFFGGDEGKFKVKHSSKSMGKLADARTALGLVYQHAEEMSAFLDSLATVDVTDQQFQQIIAQIAPVPAPEHQPGKNGAVQVKNQRSITIAEGKQNDLTNLWLRDPRAAPWTGTLLGAFQSFNTWNEHFRPQNSNGVERMMLGTLDGSFAKADADFFQIVAGLEIDMPESLLTSITAGM